MDPSGFEPEMWQDWKDLNPRPPDPYSDALIPLSYSPKKWRFVGVMLPCL